MENFGTLAKGKREVFRGIEAEAIARVVIAEDADKVFRKKIETRCKEHGVLCEVGGSMEELRALCGIEVPCGCVGYFK